MRPYQLVASDLDGTLLLPDMTVSHQNKEAIRAMTERGIRFAVSTGRTFTEIPHCVRDIPQIRYFIHSDGAVIYDRLENRRSTWCMKADLARFVLETLFSQETWLTVRCNGVSYADTELMSEASCGYHRVTPYYRAIVQQTNRHVSDFRNYCFSMEEIEMICVFFHSDEGLEHCKAILESCDQLTTASSSPNSLEIYSASAGKGNALARLAQILQIPLEQTIAVGDTTNDASILQTAGLGLAMANACDALKQQGFPLICSNTDHAAAYILNHYL